MNDLYDSGVQNSNLNMIHVGNSSTNIGIRDRRGLVGEKREEISNIVMQGSVLGPIICSNQISKNSISAYNKGLVFRYKGIVPVPPLAMVDDIATITICGNSIDIDAECDIFAKTKKIAFKPAKCHTIHIGKGSCESRHVVANKILESEDEATYLADNIGNNVDTLFKSRLVKAKRLGFETSAMAFELGFGFHLYDVAVKLLESIYINAVLTNMETWHGFHTNWIQKFETVEQQYLRKIINASHSTPIEALYLELGVVPLRYLLHKRRLSYLRVLRSRLDNEVTKQILKVQIELPVKGDFYQQTLESLDELCISLDFLDTESNETFKRCLNEIVRRSAQDWLILKGSTHSKMENYLKHYKQRTNNATNIGKYLSMASYLKYPNITREHKSLLFKARTRMLPCKYNFKSAYVDLICDYCDSDSRDDQLHLMNCPSTGVTDGNYTTQEVFFIDDPIALTQVAKTIDVALKRRTLLDDSQTSELLGL